MIRYILSKIYESIIKKRNLKFHYAPIYLPNHILTDKKYFKIQFNSKIISVGNLSAGGTGKTPLTIEIINSYLPKDKSVCAVGRNYKKKYNEHEISPGINSDGEWASPTQLGDEMYLIQSKTRAIAVSGPKKYLNALVAEKKYHPDVIVIDDGFQHQWVRRDLDIVIINDDTINRPYVYPRGRLREPLSSLSRADIIFYPDKLKIDKIYQYIRQDTLLCSFKIELNEIYSLFDENQKVDVKSNKFIPVAGIANPHRFLQSLDILGVNYDKKNIKFFDDHHYYSLEDIYLISQLAKKLNANIITTEKDAVKILRHKVFLELTNVSVYVLPIKFKIIKNEDEFISKINSIF